MAWIDFMSECESCYPWQTTTNRKIYKVGGCKYNMAKSKGLVSKLREGVKSAKKAAAVGAVSLGIGAALLGGEAKGATVIENFDELVSNRSCGSQYMLMELGDNLMVRDPNSLEDSVVAKDGSIWHMGFVKYVPGGIAIGASASNDNGYSNTFPGYEGWCSGRAYSCVFPEGSRAEDVMIAHDPDGGQMALLYANGTLVFDENINLYFTGDIEFNGSQGDLNQLPEFTYDDNPILPHMVINPVSGPVLREGPYGMDDFADFAYYWLSGCDEGNGYCEGLDFNGDGVENLADFNYISSDWNPSEPMGASSTPMYSAKTSTNVYSTTQDADGVYVAGEAEKKMDNNIKLIVTNKNVIEFTDSNSVGKLEAKLSE